ncbi:IS21-like element helper ATPase IstB (plasmid) [Vibrio parahaemolyticus]|uniref:IS21-like element helper ATPase IstB n=1 Tax=Vibrio parahaemolyticus TaxID=670 RepID=UPI0031FEF7E1
MSEQHLLPLLLKSLRLSNLITQWEPMAEKARAQSWSMERYLAELCRLELDSREEKRLQRYLKDAKLPAGKYLDNYDFTAVSGVDKEQVWHLANHRKWVKTGDNILLFGASGLGKTHLAAGIGYKLIEHGHRVKFMSANLLVQQLQQAKEELKLSDALMKLDKYSVLILDDIGYVQKTSEESGVLFELIAHRYERFSLIITSNQSFEEWDQLFDNTVMTVAAIDRLIHHAKILQCQGESYRRKEAQLNQS